MRLADIAHLRSGDKGDVSQISVIAYDPADYPLLRREVTVQRVLLHLDRPALKGAVRHELAGLGALNFVLPGMLEGGVTRSLALDGHGKTLSALLLDLEIDALKRGDAK